jgi:integrase
MSKRRKSATTSEDIRALAPRAARYVFAVPELRGLWVRVTPKGARTYCCVADAPRAVEGKRRQIWVTLGDVDDMTIDEAMERAKVSIRAIRAGLEPVDIPAGALAPSPVPVSEPEPDTIRAVMAKYLSSVDFKKQICGHEIRRHLERHIAPAWNDKLVTSIGAGDIRDLLDRVEEEGSKFVAQHVGGAVRMLLTYYAGGLKAGDQYVVPKIKSRLTKKENVRTRVLSDEEIKTLWPLWSNLGTWGAYCQVSLLTLQRQDKVLCMKWSDLSEDGTWIIPEGNKREKSHTPRLKLPALALEIIRAQPKISNNPYVFAGRIGSHFKGVHNPKAKFYETTPMEPWSFHDLRRTGCTKLYELSVPPQVVEKVMGHALQGALAHYNHHQYENEMAAALEALAVETARIIGAPGNVGSAPVDNTSETAMVAAQ